MRAYFDSRSRQNLIVITTVCVLVLAAWWRFHRTSAPILAVEPTAASSSPGSPRLSKSQIAEALQNKPTLGKAMELLLAEERFKTADETILQQFGEVPTCDLKVLIEALESDLTKQQDEAFDHLWSTGGFIAERVAPGKQAPPPGFPRFVISRRVYQDNDGVFTRQSAYLDPQEYKDVYLLRDTLVRLGQLADILDVHPVHSDTGGDGTAQR